MNEEQKPARSRRQWEAVAKARISKGEPGTAVEADFAREGLDAQTARSLVDQAVSRARSRAAGLLIGSSAFAVLGLVVTIGSYSEAASSPGGGTYWIWYGPVIAGGIAAIIALVRLASIRR
jgi:hypothetical protein